MLTFRLSLSSTHKRSLKMKLITANKLGDLRCIIRVLAVLNFCEGINKRDIASFLSVSVESVRLWLQSFLLNGTTGLDSTKPPGRPSKLTKSQKKELADIIEQGPAKAGFSGNCWRSPMIQHLIYGRYGVFYSVYYISQLLKNMGFSYQKARFVSDHLDEEVRQQWVTKTWPEILDLANRKNAYILFGDEVSFPQWGTLSYTWAKKGHQPTIKTCGKRKGYKVLGLIDYFTGRFFYKCQEDRLNSDTYIQFLKGVFSRIRKHIILIQDGARYHTSAACKKFFVKNQDRITVYNLPSYSPDYNPIEKLWKKVKEKGTHLHYFPTFQDLIDKVEESLVFFKNIHREVLSLFGFYKKMEQNA